MSRAASPSWLTARMRRPAAVRNRNSCRPTTAATPASQGSLGVSVRPLSPQERQQAETDHGLLVQQAQGAAARAGVRPGDIVLALNGKPVNDVGDVRAVLQKKPKHVALLIQRDDQRLFVPVELDRG